MELLQLLNSLTMFFNNWKFQRKRKIYIENSYPDLLLSISNV
jgi:hypothetical protein